MTSHTGDHPDLQDRLPDPSFTFDWRQLDEPGAGQRFSTYWDVEPLMRGPEPRPDWLVTDRAAVDTDLGVLKTGKEADVVVLERAVPATGEACLLAAKRYRTPEHRAFQRSAAYTEDRRTRRSRDARAINRKSAFGREVAAGQWAMAEWEALKRCWSAGAPVPYPVQIEGTEILMELVTDADGPAPRLVGLKPGPDELADWLDQVRAGLGALARQGWVHGDLSPYNLLVADGRVVFIDLPQVLDLAANPNGHEFLLRDCRNVASWFTRRGLPVDEHDLYAEVAAQAY